MKYNNRLKGGVSEALLKCLLVDAGYRIVLLGVEEVVRELDVFSPAKPELPKQLKSLPDSSVGYHGSLKAKSLKTRNALHSPFSMAKTILVELFLMTSLPRGFADGGSVVPVVRAKR